MMEYYSRTGYAFNFINKEVIVFAIVAIILIVIFPFFIFIVIPIGIIGFLIVHFVLGTIVKIEGKSIRIYKADSFALNPGNNEMIISYGRNLHTSVNIVKDNISNIRKITDTNEIRQIKKIPRLHKRIQIGASGHHHGAGSGSEIIFHLNKKDLEKVSFISDFNKLVEIIVKKIKIRRPYIFGKEDSLVLTNFKILVSVKNPDEFINSFYSSSL